MAGAAETPLQLAAPRLAYQSGDGRVSGELLFNGVKLALSGTAGPVEGAAWPLKLQLAGGGAIASLSGTTEQAGLAVAGGRPVRGVGAGRAGFASAARRVGSRRRCRPPG